ncbi:MAG: glycosyltransferase 87 family protein, partial [Myxococcota bacterium]|nr:glycosyltransferase 87 family protein [Myxococcota bacterium]
MHRPLAESALVALLASLGFALLAWPWPLDPMGSFIGDSGNDQHALAWTLQWVADRMAAGALPWGFTDRVGWPDGGTLFPANLLEAIMVAPLTWAAGGIAALGALTLLHHAAAAGATWGWLRARGADRAGALAGSLVVALGAPLVVSSWNGNPDVTGIAWVCGALWACEVRRPTLAGVLVGAGALANPYVAVLGAGAVGMRLLRQPRALARAAIPAAALGLMGWGLTASALSAPDAFISRGARDAGGLMGTATLQGLLHPAPEILVTDPEHGLSRVGTGAYLGTAA